MRRWCLAFVLLAAACRSGAPSEGPEPQPDEDTAPWRESGRGTAFSFTAAPTQVGSLRGEVTGITAHAEQGHVLEVTTEEGGVGQVHIAFAREFDIQRLFASQLEVSRYPNPWLRDDRLTFTDESGVIFAARYQWMSSVITVGPVRADPNGNGLGQYALDCGVVEHVTMHVSTSEASTELKTGESAELVAGAHRYDVLNVNNFVFIEELCTDMSNGHYVEVSRLP